MQIFTIGHEHRSTAATKMNAHSSRSHAISYITVKGVNKITGTETIGKRMCHSRFCIKERQRDCSHIELCRESKGRRATKRSSRQKSSFRNSTFRETTTA